MSGPTRQAACLAGRTAIVTGGSRGIGRAIALGFADEGANVVVASRTGPDCEAVVSNIILRGGRAAAVPTDTGDVEQVRNLVDETVREFGGIAIVVNNAADPTLAMVEDVSPQLWDRVFSVNVKGPTFLASYALPHLEASGHGSVINVLSIGVWLGGDGHLLYRSTKSALWGATKVMSKEWGRRGVRVNALAPGPVETDMLDWLGDEGRQTVRSLSALGRIAEPTEVVPAAVYLASDASSFVTGAALTIDGGLLP